MAPTTSSPWYADRLVDLEGRRWKRLLDVQAPYRWNLRRLQPGYILDVGCGVGRNLLHLDGHGVGVDHNADAVTVARSRGLVAYTTDEFPSSEHAQPGAFDSLLFAHVLEHLTELDAGALVEEYLPHLCADGRVIMIVPQPAGQRSDPTHVHYVDGAVISRLAARNGLEVASLRSFPFPSMVGWGFRHNETVAVCRRRS